MAPSDGHDGFLSEKIKPHKWVLLFRNKDNPAWSTCVFTQMYEEWRGRQGKQNQAVFMGDRCRTGDGKGDRGKD